MALLSLRTLSAVFALGSLCLGQTATAQQAPAINRGVVELETSGTNGISVRIAEDLSEPIQEVGIHVE
jgi:hypothetical protein